MSGFLKTSAKLIAVSTLVSATPLATGATLAEFGFTGNSLSSTDPQVIWTTADLGSGGGVPLAFDGSNGQPAPSLDFTMGDINDGTIQDDDYYTFTITPDAGVTLDFTNFSFDINKISGGADVDAYLFSSQDSFTSAIGSGTVSAQNSWETKVIGLSGLTTTSAATEFRLYLDTGGTFAPNQIKLDNLSLTGDATAVPEPGAIALLCLSGLLLTARRRR